MKRVIIKNLNGVVTNQAELLDPIDWIASGNSQKWWGTPEQIKWKDQCSAEELARVSEQTEVMIDPGMPGEPGPVVKRYLLSENPDVWKFEEECTPEQIASAIRFEDVQLPGIDPIPPTYRTQVKVAATYTIEIVDIQAEIDADNQKKDQIRTFKQRLKTILQKADADMTAAERNEALVKLARMLLLRGDLD